MANNDALAAAIRLLAENLNQNRNDNPDPAGEMFKKLAQVKPPYFEGGGDPTFLENWIREFDKIFAALNCPENMRVDQAAMYLKEEADIWWRDNGDVLRAEANFGWETFKTKLREKFYPPFLRKQKAQEFINLQMNNMSITEYYNKFMNLARFAPEVVPTEELKAQRFEQGLTKQLQKNLAGKTFKTLDKVYGRAAHLYCLNARSAPGNGSVGEKRNDFGNSSDQGNSKKPRNENFQNRNVQNNGGSSRTNGEAERHYNCKRCGKDHPGKDCDGNLVVCRYCNKKGHREFECFSKLKQQGNGNKLTSTSNQGGNSNGHNGNGKNGNVHNNNSENQGKNVTQGRLFVMSKTEAERSFDTGPDDGRLKFDWPIRKRICIGIAKGLAFLHEESRIKIVHRDIKATNVLLDRNLNPKISDFGLARLNEEEVTHISTRIAGTIGYMAPEYALWGYLTPKADVYSFGVVVLEVVAGRSNMKFEPSEDHFCLLDWAYVLKQKGDLMELMDPTLGTDYNKEEASIMIQIALLCTNPSPALRPMMSEALNMLEGNTAVQELILEPNKVYSHEWLYQTSKKQPLKQMSGSETKSLIHSSDAPRTDCLLTSKSHDLYPVDTCSH